MLVIKAFKVAERQDPRNVASGILTRGKHILQTSQENWEDAPLVKVACGASVGPESNSPELCENSQLWWHMLIISVLGHGQEHL